MHILQRLWKAQMFKNIYGSAVGIAIALLLYGAFQTSAAFVASIINPPAQSYEGGIITDGESYQKFLDRVKTLRGRAAFD